MNDNINNIELLARKREDELTDYDKSFLESVSDFNLINFLLSQNMYFVKYMNLLDNNVVSSMLTFITAELLRNMSDFSVEGSVYKSFFDVYYDYSNYGDNFQDVVFSLAERVWSEYFKNESVLIGALDNLCVDIGKYLNYETLYELRNNGIVDKILLNNSLDASDVVKRDCRLIDFIDDSMVTVEIIDFAIDNGYVLNSYSPSVITGDSSYIKKFVVDKGQVSAIDYAESTGLNEENILEAIKRDYKVGSYSSKFILNNPLYVGLFIDNGQVGVINIASEVGLSDDNIRNAIDNGYILNSASLRVIKSNPSYIEKYIVDRNQPDAIDYAEGVALSDENIFAAVKCGYVLRDDSVDVIKNNPLYVKLLVDKNQVAPRFLGYDVLEDAESFLRENPKYIETFVKEGEVGILDLAEGVELTDEIIDDAIDKGYVLDYKSPSVIRGNLEYIKKFVDNGQFFAIDYALDSGLDEEIVTRAINDKYEVSEHTSLVIRSNPLYVRKFIENGQLEIVNLASNDGLSKSNIESAIDRGYQLNSDSPSVIKENFEYVGRLINNGQVRAIDYALGAGLDDKNILAAIRHGYRLRNDSIDLIKNNPLYVQMLIGMDQVDSKWDNYEILYDVNTFVMENPRYLDIFIEDGQPEIIDIVKDEVLTEEMIVKAIDAGYVIGPQSPLVIRKNSQYINMLVNRGQVQAIDYADISCLNDEVISNALNKGYSVSNYTVSLLKKNVKFAEVFIKNGHPEVIDLDVLGILNEDNIFLAMQNGYDISGISLKRFTYLMDFLSSDKLEMLDGEIVSIYKNTKELLEEGGKVNTLDSNLVLNYDVMRYVYPYFGWDFTLRLIKYDTDAASNIVREVKAGNIEKLNKYLEFLGKYNLCVEDVDIHNIFSGYFNMQELVDDILLGDRVFTDDMVNNFKRIIFNKNRFGINTVSALENYEVEVRRKYEEIYNYGDIEQIRDYVAFNFGFNDSIQMMRHFEGFQFDNFKNIRFAMDDILEGKDEKEKEVLRDKLLLTKKDVQLILVMKRLMASNNVEEIKEVFLKTVNASVNLMEDVSELKNKIRMIYGLQFNSQFTNGNKFESLKRESKCYYVDGVLVMEPSMDSKYNFLAHELYGYDAKMEGYSDKIRKDPSLWFKLEGATTISTSSISEKGCWVLEPGNKDAVYYLFNQTDDDFLLFMYEQDLGVSHGGYKLNPTSLENLMTDFETLNQKCAVRPDKADKYDEVAGWREKIKPPCALLCLTDEVNEDTLRAAKYFGVPVIKDNMKLRHERKVENRKNAILGFKENVTYQDMYDIFYDGLNIDTIDDKVELCVSSLLEKYKSQEIDEKLLLQRFVELENIVNKVGCVTNVGKKNLRKLELYKQSFSVVRNLTDEQVLDLENASMKDGGLVYRINEDGKEVQVSLAVNKSSYERQNYKAEVKSAVSKIQEIINSDSAVLVDVVGNDKLKLAKQEDIDVDFDATSKLQLWEMCGGDLDSKYADSLLREYVVDFLVCNFECGSDKFVIDKNGNLRGIDKSQSFNGVDDDLSLDASFAFNPSGSSKSSIYKILFERYVKGDVDLDLGVVEDAIGKVRNISDDEYREIFRGYADSLDKNKSDVVLDMIVKRKHEAVDVLSNYISELKNKKLNGGMVDDVREK